VHGVCPSNWACLRWILAPILTGIAKSPCSIGAPHFDRARVSLEKLAKLKAVTPEAVQAKARIVPAIFKHCEGALEDFEFAFIEAFAADVKAYFEPIIEERWRTDNRPATIEAVAARPMGEKNGN
jgi:hypothetical protein